MTSLLTQLKKRRLALGLKQKDMLMRIGISRQQYQYLESRGNPGLNTLELIAKGLKSELLLIPAEKLSSVKALLEENPENEEASSPLLKNKDSEQNDASALANDPWKKIPGFDE